MIAKKVVADHTCGGQGVWHGGRLGDASGEDAGVESYVERMCAGYRISVIERDRAVGLRPAQRVVNKSMIGRRAS